jgi:meiotic recombination protein DMC1
MSASKQKAAATVTDTDAVETTVFEDTYTSIDELASVGINAADIEKLKQAGIFTIGGIFQKTKKALREIRGFSDVKVRSYHCQ